MVKNIFSILLKIILCLLIFIVNIGIANLLPPPWNHLNILILSAAWVLIFRENFGFIGYIFALSVLSELFHSTPFGVDTAALLITVFLTDWLLVNVLTNRFFLIVFFSGALSIIIFRIASVLLLYFWNIFSGGSVYLNESFYLDLLLEASINGAALTLAYLVPIIYLKKFNPSYLSEHDYAARRTTI